MRTAPPRDACSGCKSGVCMTAQNALHGYYLKKRQRLYLFLRNFQIFFSRALWDAYIFIQHLWYFVFGCLIIRIQKSGLLMKYKIFCCRSNAWNDQKMKILYGLDNFFGRMLMGFLDQTIDEFKLLWYNYDVLWYIVTWTRWNWSNNKIFVRLGFMQFVRKQSLDKFWKYAKSVCRFIWNPYDDTIPNILYFLDGWMFGGKVRKLESMDT